MVLNIIYLKYFLVFFMYQNATSDIYSPEKVWGEWLSWYVQLKLSSALLGHNWMGDLFEVLTKQLTSPSFERDVE